MIVSVIEHLYIIIKYDELPWALTYIPSTYHNLPLIIVEGYILIILMAQNIFLSRNIVIH